jgi:hypothetical protein
MRVGRVEYSLGYVVDLDNKDMVNRAKEAILEDMRNVLSAANSGEEIIAGIDIIKEGDFSEADIPSWLSEDYEEEESLNEQQTNA